MKKLLALVLALVMVMSLSVVGVSAEFADEADIDHTEAVEVMNALGIIGGKENNNFDPNGNVKRSEMAKMVTIALLGDIDPAAFAGAATDLTDISGHWAEGYIKYCVSQGIVGGRGNGTFDPEATVTTAEASKMLLVALGYNADIRGYVGDGWTINVARDAQQKGLYKEIVNISSSKAMDRDDAAQLIYNTLNATRVVAVQTYNSDGTTSTQYQDAFDNGVTTNCEGQTTLLNKTFDSVKAYTSIESVSYDAAKKEYTYVFDNDEFGTDPADLYDTVLAGGGTTFKTDKDYSDLYGQIVAIVFKDDSSKEVYGVYGAGKILAEATMGEIKTSTGGDYDATAQGASNTKIKLGDTVVELKSGHTTDSTDVYYFNNVSSNGILTGGATATTTIDTIAGYVYPGGTTKAAYNKIVAIDNDDDGKADAFVAYPTIAQEVTYVGTTSFIVGAATGGNNDSAQKTYSKNTDDGLYYVGGDTTKPAYNFPEGLKKGDYVAIPYYGVTNVTRDMTIATTLEGKVVGKNGNFKTSVDGTWLADVENKGTLGNTYTFALLGGYIVGADEVSSESKEILFATGSAYNGLDGLRVKAVFTDGTTDTITINKLNDATPSSDMTADTHYYRLYTYTKKDNGKYDIDFVGTNNKAGNSAFAESDTTTGLYTKTGSTKTLDGSQIADDAVIFIRDVSDSNKVTVIDGKTLKTYSTTAGYASAGTGYVGKTHSAQLLYATTGGVYGVKTAAFAVNTTISSGSSYGYITSDVISARSGSNTVYTFTMWTKDGAQDVTAKNSGIGAALTKGMVVKYAENTDGTVTCTTAFNNANDLFPVAVTGYNATDGVITLSKNDGVALGQVDAEFTDSAKFAFIDTDAVKGIGYGKDGGTIAVAQRKSDGSYVMNALAAVNANDEVTFLIVDTNNDLDIKFDDGTKAVDTKLDTGVSAPTASSGGTVTTSGLAGTAVTLTDGTNLDLASPDSYIYGVEGEYFDLKVTIGHDTALDGGKTIRFFTSGTNVDVKTLDLTLGSNMSSGDVEKASILIADDGADDLSAGVDITVGVVSTLTMKTSPITTLTGADAASDEGDLAISATCDVAAAAEGETVTVTVTVTGTPVDGGVTLTIDGVTPDASSLDIDSITTGSGSASKTGDTLVTLPAALIAVRSPSPILWARPTCRRPLRLLT